MPNCLPEPKNEDNLRRKVGFELEFAGLEIEETTEIIRKLYGGTIRKKNRYEFTIQDTELGDFEVELDARILKKMADSDILEDWDLNIDDNKIKDSISDVVDRLARAVIPLEIVMPPLPYDEIEKLEQLRSRLQQQKAEGTESSWMHAFGLHINVEVPNLGATTLLRYLRSFFVLYPWLIEELNIDISRRLSPFIDHFPDRYVELVLNQNYNPSVDRLIADYLEFNPTRNRPLDMMPIWAVIGQQIVTKTLGDIKNNPRPTFHYRLPNSHIEDPEWSLKQEWNRWMEVEKLAADDEMLGKLSELYLLRKGETFLAFKKEWAQTTEILLDL